MANINILDKKTIDQIAAGEVIERPASVVKELLENAIDAGATAVTIEIKDGGTSFIRVTDNGCGIDKDQIPSAFLRHATSKIKSVEDLLNIHSLGFRGEALSSIAAVSQVELITKTAESLTGSRYQIDGGTGKELEEIGSPEGTTFIVRNLFYNTPARKKFLKSAATEGSYISDLTEKIALSRPDISIRFIQNNQNKLHTSGNHNLKDIVYSVYGRDVSANLLNVDTNENGIKVSGFAGKPVISRGNRNYENYYINGRYIKSNIISRAIEEAYKPFMMQHKYPFTLLHFTIKPEFLDVNVHPTKMELKFQDSELVYSVVYDAVSHALAHKELIPEIELIKPQDTKEKELLKKENIPEPFEVRRKEQLMQKNSIPFKKSDSSSEKVKKEAENTVQEHDILKESSNYKSDTQMDLFSEKLLEPKARQQHKLIGQLFDTYWLVEFNEQLYIIDQHAAHEKVLYEQTMKNFKTRNNTSQQLAPPIILTLNSSEELLLQNNLEYFTGIGFEIEPFGGKEYAVRAVPANLFSIAKRELLIEMIDGLSDDMANHNPDIIYERVASLSCKAAVKGNHHMSMQEADSLIDMLLDLENPYACPHGRPTIISMSKYELEKKFKRIV